jgi:type II secretory pathway pseudopilin PulG
MMYFKDLQTSRLGANQRGITMLEVTLILAALVVLSAAVAPTVLRTVNNANARNVVSEMEALHAAMLGDMTDGTFGYMGDMGRFPYTLDELVVQTDEPFFVRSETSGVGYGWNGPYVVQGRTPTDFQLDPWGNPYDISVVGFGQLRSYGPNGLPDDNDDITYPAYPVDPYGTLLVQVKGHSGEAVLNSPDGCAVTLQYSDSGEFSSVYADVAPFTFEFVHRGLHEVEATCTAFTGELVSEVAVVSVRGGGAQQTVELHLELGEEISAESAESDSASDSAATGAGDAEVTTWD